MAQHDMLEKSKQKKELNESRSIFKKLSELISVDDSIINIWDDIVKIIKPKIPENMFNTFFANLKPFGLVDDSFVLVSPDKRIVSHIKQRYDYEIKKKFITR